MEEAEQCGLPGENCGRVRGAIGTGTEEMGAMQQWSDVATTTKADTIAVAAAAAAADLEGADAGNGEDLAWLDVADLALIPEPSDLSTRFLGTPN